MARGKICRRQWPRMETYVVSNGCQILGFCSQRVEKEACIYVQFLRTKANLHKIKIERRGLLGFLCFEATKAMVWEALLWLCDVVESRSKRQQGKQLYDGGGSVLCIANLFCLIEMNFTRSQERNMADKMGFCPFWAN